MSSCASWDFWEPSCASCAFFLDLVPVQTVILWQPWFGKNKNPLWRVWVIWSLWDQCRKHSCCQWGIKCYRYLFFQVWVCRCVGVGVCMCTWRNMILVRSMVDADITTPFFFFFFAFVPNNRSSKKAEKNRQCNANCKFDWAKSSSCASSVRFCGIFVYFFQTNLYLHNAMSCTVACAATDKRDSAV